MIKRNFTYGVQLTNYSPLTSEIGSEVSLPEVSITPLEYFTPLNNPNITVTNAPNDPNSNPDPDSSDSPLL